MNQNESRQLLLQKTNDEHLSGHAVSAASRYCREVQSTNNQPCLGFGQILLIEQNIQSKIKLKYTFKPANKQM